MRYHIIILILIIPCLCFAQEQSNSDDTADSDATQEELNPADPNIDIDVNSDFNDEDIVDQVEPLDDTAEKLDSLYHDEESEGGDWGGGLVRGEDLVGITIQRFIENAIIVSDLKMLFRRNEYRMGTLSSLYRFAPDIYYVEAGLGVSIQNLRRVSGTVAERSLDAAIRLGVGAQLDFSAISVDIKFIGIDAVPIELDRISLGKKEAIIENKRHFRESLSIGILYFP